MAGLYDEKIVGLKEQRDLARRLREQASAPAEMGQMVSGWYVPNYGNAITNALRNIVGGYKESQAEDKIAEAEREKAQATIQAMNQAGIEAPSALLSQAGTKEEAPSWTSRASAFLRGEDQPKPTPAQPYQQNVAQNLTPDQRESGLMNLLQVNPDVASGAIGLYNASTNRALTKAEKDYQHAKDIQEQDWKQKTYEESRADRLARESADRDLKAAIAGNRQPSPVQVIDPVSGQPMYVRPEQAYGMRPFTAQTAKQEQADIAKAQQQEQASLSAQQVLDQAAMLNAHPGRQMATGASSWTSNIPGTEAKGFQANLNTFKAQTFIPMVSALKGMGALSDAEGKKLSESVGALDPSMPEKDFQDSLKSTTKFLYDKAKAAGLNVSLPDFAGQQSNDGGWSIRPKGQ